MRSSSVLAFRAPARRSGGVRKCRGCARGPTTTATRLLAGRERLAGLAAAVPARTSRASAAVRAVRRGGRARGVWARQAGRMAGSEKCAGSTCSVQCRAERTHSFGHPAPPRSGGAARLSRELPAISDTTDTGDSAVVAWARAPSVIEDPNAVLVRSRIPRTEAALLAGRERRCRPRRGRRAGSHGRARAGVAPFVAAGARACVPAGSPSNA
jgi:hypothetical protein